MRANGRETTIAVDDKVPTIRITRRFDFPPSRVFRAHAEPDLLVRWLGPRDIEMTIDYFDCRTGGSYRYVHSRDENQFGFHGSFHEVRPNELIVQTFTFEGAPESVSLDRVTFDPSGDGGTRLNIVGLVGSFEERDAILASGMAHGVEQGYEKLDELLLGLS